MARSVVIVGAGPAGMSAAIAAHERGARVTIVDEAALVQALRDGTIAGAGLDVFGTEPLPLDHPFRSLPNTVISPHLGYVTEETYRIFYGQARQEVEAFLRGEPVRVLR